MTVAEVLKRLKQKRFVNQDPSLGLGCNGISITYRISTKYWMADIARTPQFWIDSGTSADIQGRADKANGLRYTLNKFEQKVKKER